MASTKLASTQLDPIHAAIVAHRAAWQAWTTAPYMAFAFSDRGVVGAHRAALTALLETPCATRAGAESLLRHLRACLAADRNGIDLCTFARIIDARTRDLALFLDEDQQPPRRLGEIVAAIVRRLRGAGEALAALALVVGGAFLIGAASLL